MTNPLADALRDLLTAHHGGLRPTKEWEKAEEALAVYDARQCVCGVGEDTTFTHSLGCPCLNKRQPSDLVTRLRTPKCDGRDQDTMWEAADRIEELELSQQNIDGQIADAFRDGYRAARPVVVTDEMVNAMHERSKTLHTGYGYGNWLSETECRHLLEAALTAKSQEEV